ncbi:MFS transporter [Galactobacter valiniphilus]|uniref:MFS transporter n=1 Tax=Galactobacter valiniphilus TaxID=2676122 RepID=UPI001F18FF65|nr:MFS transporter [Galactobacter valiniphilus]
MSALPLPSPARPEPSSPFAGGLLLTTLGSFALIFLAAFEALAVATIMPVVTRDLHGEGVYALAMAAPLATGIVGMVGAGGWSDRTGPRGPFYTGVALFTAGLIVCGLAPDMLTFTIGRILQGFGAGAINVTIYVLVARLYPPILHARVFGLFAAAWVLPSLVGPYLAGVVAQATSWHWVFLGVVALVAIAVVLMLPSLARLGSGPAAAEAAGEQPAEAPATARALAPDLLRAAVIAAAVLTLGTLGSRAGWGPAVLIGALVLVAFLLRPLLPVGAYRLSRGLPSAVILRAVIAAAYFGAEAYLPLIFNTHYRLDVSQSGLALTAAAVAWALASWVQGRFLQAAGDRALLTSAVLVVFASLAAVAGAIAASAPVPLVVVLWGVGGFGMGLAYPRLSTMVIRLSPVRAQGFNSAALNIADSTGSALGLAALGTLQRGEEFGPLVLILSLAAVLAGLGILVARRTGGAAQGATAAAPA